MKHTINTQNRMSTFSIKQLFIRILANEFDNCGFDVVLGFESTYNNRICTLHIVGHKRLEVNVNLGYVKQSFFAKRFSELFKAHYCAFFVAEYIKQLERAKNVLPQSYFEGLAFLNAIEVYKAKTVVRVFSPLSHWNEKPKRSYCLRPLEISSAINAINKLILFDSHKMDEKDKKSVRDLHNSLLLYASLPEISYVYECIPVYALVNSLKSLSNFASEDPAIDQEFPILSLFPFHRLDHLAVDDLFLHCLQSGNSFLVGIAIRLIAFLHQSDYRGVANHVREELINALSSYVDCGILYCNEVHKNERCFINDNLFAVKVAVKSIYEYTVMNELGMICGNIHSIA